MNAERLRRAMEIFDEVCDLVGEERAAALSRLCAGDAEVRGEVERMLRYDSQALGPIARSGAGVEVLAAEVGGDEPSTPERIGRYRVIREIGRGGMGVVYEAEQESPRRRVALKVVQRGLASQAVLSRFHREAQVLGQLQHRGIAHIYESGTAQIGEGRWPFLAMELVEGRPLDVHAEEKRLSVAQRLELLARVCDAVQHAHQKGVIHRDLKPANVLVMEEVPATSADPTATAVDTIGQPKILDFGVARFADPEAQQTVQTHAGQIVGTLAYMSPEQVAGRVDAIDTRSDVYALGVILFRVLAGRAPYELGGVPMAQAARTIAEESAPTLGGVVPSLRGDVSTIVGKAMEKDPERRYASAAAMAEDIRRHLRDEPIAARPASAAYQLMKFARRNRAMVGGLIGTILALAGGLAAVSVLLAKVSAERNAASVAQDRAVRIGGFQSEMLRNIDIAAVGQDVLGGIRRQLEKAGMTSDDADRVAGQMSGADVARAAIDDAVLGAAVSKLDSGFIDDPLVEAELRASLASAYDALFMYDQELAQVDRAFTLLNAHIGPDAPETISTGLTRAAVLHRLLRYEDARAATEDLLRRASAAPGLDPGLVLRIRVALVDALLALQQIDDAEGNLVALRDGLRAQEHPSEDDLLPVEMRLAAVYLSKHEYARAEALFASLGERVRRRNGNREDAQALAMLQSQSVALAALGRDAEAEAALRRFIDGWRRIGGDDHEATIVGRIELGKLLMRAGRADAALALLRLAEDSAARTMPLTRSHRTEAAVALSSCLLSLKRFDECEQVVSALLDARRIAGLPTDDAECADLQTILRLCHSRDAGS